MKKAANSGKLRRVLTTCLLTLALTGLLCPAALADTDGKEIQVAQPDQLVLQLGVRWAGVEFELRTDAGVFPVPVVVDDSGVLTMDLGGSKTYTLTCINSSVPIPDPATESDPAPDTDSASEPQTPGTPSQEAPELAPTRTIPTMHLVLFLSGLAIAIGGLIILHISKRRRMYDYEDWDEEDDEEL